MIQEEKNIDINLELEIRDKITILLREDEWGNNEKFQLADEVKAAARRDEAMDLFSISVSDDGEEMLECYGIMIDEDSREFWQRGENLTLIGDDYSGDAALAMDYLEQAPWFVPIEDDDRICVNPCSIYISRFFVNPAYRGRHIASAIFGNLAALFQYKYNLTLRYASIIVKADKPEGMTEEEMERIMAKTIVDAGFERISPINNENKVYAKRF